jgi:hypothetical protein
MEGVVHAPPDEDRARHRSLDRPLLVGMAFSVWIVAPMSPAKKRHQPAEESARDDLDRLQGTWTGVVARTAAAKRA